MIEAIHDKRGEDTAHTQFCALVASIEPRLRRALAGAVGIENAHDAVAEALAWAWEHWPEVELTLPLGSVTGGSRLYLGVEKREARSRWPRPEFEYPVKVRYELDGRITTDLDQLGEWMRDRPPIGFVHPSKFL